MGAPERKKPLGIQAFAESRIENAAVVRDLTLRRNSLHRLMLTQGIAARGMGRLRAGPAGWDGFKLLDVAAGPPERIGRTVLRTGSQLPVKKLLGERPQEEQTEIKQSGPYSCIVLAVLEIERQGEAAVSAFIPGRV